MSSTLAGSRSLQVRTVEEYDGGTRELGGGWWSDCCEVPSRFSRPRNPIICAKWAMTKISRVESSEQTAPAPDYRVAWSVCLVFEVWRCLVGGGGERGRE